MQSPEKPKPAEKAKPPLADAPLMIGEHVIPPGQRRTVDLPLSVLSNHTPMALTAHVVHGRRVGPALFVSAAIHGDEIIGVEIVRRVFKAAALKRLRGTLFLVPIVNAFGFISHNRYLPDRRDLNRSFPGTPKGSLAAQLAYLFLEEIVMRAQYGIDLHSAAQHRINLPQARVDADHAKACELARAFGAPVILNSPTREGSLRRSAAERGVAVMVYEAGEALRFDEFAIRVGVKGVLRVMRHLGMLAPGHGQAAAAPSPVSRKSSWVRAPEGGVFRASRTIGDVVADDEVIGVIADAFGETECDVRSEAGGLIVGRTNLPVVNQGDALFHVAQVPKHEAVERALSQMEQDVGTDPLFDEDEIL